MKPNKQFKAKAHVRSVTKHRPKAIHDYYPGIDYQPLFDHMSKRHGLTLTTSEMDEIIGLSAYILK